MSEGGRRWWAYDDVHCAAWPCRLDSRFDVALLVDVLEHYPGRAGVAALDALAATATQVIVATPLDPMQWPQRDLPNPLEEHRSSWLPRRVQALATRRGWRFEYERLPDSWVGSIYPDPVVELPQTGDTARRGWGR